MWNSIFNGRGQSLLISATSGVTDPSITPATSDLKADKPVWVDKKRLAGFRETNIQRKRKGNANGM